MNKWIGVVGLFIMVPKHGCGKHTSERTLRCRKFCGRDANSTEARRKTKATLGIHKVFLAQYLCRCMRVTSIRMCQLAMRCAHTEMDLEATGYFHLLFWRLLFYFYIKREFSTSLCLVRPRLLNFFPFTFSFLLSVYLGIRIFLLILYAYVADIHLVCWVI